jgi:two-component system LytT family sensor kinase
VIDKHPRPRWIAIACITVLGWTVFGVLSAAQIHVRDGTASGGAPWHDEFNIVYFYWAWALVTPLVLAAARDLLRVGPAAATRLVVHIPVAFAVIGIQSALYAAFQVVDGRTRLGALPSAATLAMARHVGGDLLTYAVLVASYAMFRYYQRVQKEQLQASETARRASELEVALMRARLEALTGQLRPHFLFNTLNMVSGLVAKQDAVTANRVIARLGDLLRVTLSTSEAHEVTLARELELTRHYLEIAQLRFGPELTIVETIDSRTLDRLVPRFILQPLVENALIHGVGERAGGGRIEVIAQFCADGLVLEVRDDGPGFGAAVPEANAGLGVNNVRERLQHVYGDSAQLTVGNAPTGGVVARIRISA